jgi:uncharacterized protein
MNNPLIQLVALSLLCASFGAVAQNTIGRKERNNEMTTTNKNDFVNAVKNGETARVKQLLSVDASLAETTDDDGMSVLLKAVYYQRNDIVELLLAARRDLNLFEAAATGRTARVEELIRKDSSIVNSFSPDGFYALGLAIFFRHPDTARFLMEAGADVNAVARNPMKVRPLHAAAAAREAGIARLLIERGADVNARQQEDFAPLHEAAANGDIEFVRLLLDHGADINAKTAAGKTALRYALDAGQQNAASLLRERGGRE